MENDIRKETLVLNYVILRKSCTMPSSNLIMMALFVSVKGVRVYMRMRMLMPLCACSCGRLRMRTCVFARIVHCEGCILVFH